MPVYDIDTSQRRLERGGKIRLGIKKTASNGKQYPAETAYFVLRDAPDVAAAYGDQPTELYIYLVGRTVDDNLSAYHELWDRAQDNGAVVRLCRGDGRHIVELIDPDNKRGRVVRNGVVVTPYTEEDNAAYAPGQRVPCPGLEHDLYWRCQKCHLRASLQVLVRDPQDRTQLVNNRAVYYQIDTGSVINVRNLYAQLNWAADMAASMGRLDLRGIGMILKRAPRQITYQDSNGVTKTTTKHLLSLEFDMEWLERANAAMHAAALGAGPAVLQLGSGQQVDPGTGELLDDPYNEPLPDFYEADVIDETDNPDPDLEPPASAPLPEPAAAEDGPQRPYPPVTLKERFEEYAATLTGKNPDPGSADTKQRGKIVGQLESILRAAGIEAPTTARRAYLHYLTGSESSKTLSERQAYVFSKMLFDIHSAEETVQAAQYAISNGQPALFEDSAA